MGALVWALGFATVNIYLQFAFPSDVRVQLSWPEFTAVNLSVAALKVLGAVVALATVTRWGRRLPDALVSTAAWGAAAMLLIYSGYGAVLLTVQGGWAQTLNAGGTFTVPAWGYMLFFLVPGVLFALAAADHQRRTGTRFTTVLLGALGAPLVLAAVFLGLSAALV